MKLLDIPKVGSRIKERLIDHYSDEEAALDAIVRGDIAGLLEAVSERQALSLVQWAAGAKYGVKPDGFLATEEALRIYRHLIMQMASFAHTDYARMKIGTIFPSPSPELIEENRKLAQASIAWAKRLEDKGVGILLAMIGPLRERPQTRIRDRALLADSPDTLKMLKSRSIDKLIDIHLAESEQEMAYVAKSYSHVCIVGKELDSPPGMECAESLEDWYLVPEAVLGFYTDNLDTLLSAVRAARILQEADISRFDGLDALQKLITSLETREDSEVTHLARAIDGLDKCINDAVSQANLELKRRIESSSVTLAGSDILQALGRGDGARELFEIQMKGIFNDIIKEARSMAAKELDLAGPDAARLGDIFSEEVQYPIELDGQALRGFEMEMRGRLESKALRSRRALARGLADKKEQVKRLIFALNEFDFCYAIGAFALARGLQMPELVKEPSLAFMEGINLNLEKAEPVSYSLGRTGIGEHGERAVLLSGVNSGGKTSLLDLISQIVILAHMGMPVPARGCSLAIFEELYYFSKSRGTLSAGAFETAMRKFAVVENSKRKLVLADELESITEPGASARIIACMLDELNQLGSVAVFVSHLAEEVRRYAQTPVRIDGIEAQGLDADGNLIVCRSPRYNHLARSTPELILDRLARTTFGPEREFYSRLLAKFK